MVYHRSSKSGAEADSSSRAKSAQNVFRNDGSFLEMFKRMQEASSSASSSSTSCSTSAEATSPMKSSVSSAAAATDNKPVPVPVPDSEGKKSGSVGKLPVVGKRRGGRVLPTGQVKKVKQEKREVGEDKPKDAWSQYLAEVKRYRETTCEEEGKTRPLVKTVMPTAIMAAAKKSTPTKSEEVLETAPFDPRFPNTNQTRYCYQSYLDFHRCQKVKGEGYEPCAYFKKVYTSLCPFEWVDKWDTQISEGNFAGHI